MSNSLKSILWWIIAIIFTIGIAIYQRTTGPTYPERGSVTLNNSVIKYKLIRTADNDKDAEIAVEVADNSVTGEISYRRFKSHDSLSSVPLARSGDKLIFMMPKQPAAGKMEYSISLSGNNETVKLTEKPIVMRFKGPVPAFVLMPHILLMFLAMLFSTRAGLEALRNGNRTYLYSLLTLIFLVPGGLILGPFVQNYAFGDYWTGWPMKGIFNFGDMTDNKTLVAGLGWIIAVIMLRKNHNARGWAIAAAIILLAVYMVPHSVLGSEIDYTQQAD
jgi:uncharacterized membrane protein YjjB (DUF3815 family)